MNKELQQYINDFILDPDVATVKRWNISRDIFSILSLDETRHSQMIAWLLNPKESHQLADYFIKELLKSISPVESIGSLQKIVTGSFSDTYIETEFTIANNGRADVALINYKWEFIIFIENKIGHRTSKEQFNKYENWKCKRYPKFAKVYILMDYDKTHNLDSNWFSTDYSWLTTALDNVINKDITHPEINRILRDYYCHLQGTFEKIPYYRDMQKLLSKIVHKHHNLLKELKNKILADNIPLRNLKHSKFLSSKKDSERQLAEFYWQYQTLLEDLFDYSKFEYFAEEIKNKLDFPIETYARDKYLHIRNAHWSQFQEDAQSFWGVYFQLSLIPHEKTEKYNLHLYVNWDLVKKNSSEVLQSIKEVKTNRKRNYVDTMEEKTVIDRTSQYIKQINACLQ